MDMYYIISFFSGLILGLVIMFFPYRNLQKEQSQLKKRYEKTSIGADDSDLRVKTLENKIKTLETALEKSLKKD